MNSRGKRRLGRDLALFAFLFVGPGCFAPAQTGQSGDHVEKLTHPSAITPAIDSCSVLPANNIWNAPVDLLPVHPDSSSYINTIGPAVGLHPDFGSGLWEGGPIGIPYVTVSGTQPKVSVIFDYSDESDPGPYPVPPGAPIEGGSQSTGDRHVLVLERDHCILYELYSAHPQPDGSWQAGSGAVYDLKSSALRPAGWTSADAAGLPILPGLVRYDEVAAGEINHAIRFTVPQTQHAYAWPARHYASSLTETRFPPMGARFRLNAGFDISGYSPDVQVILRALKKYGMILADNGSAWYLSGAPDDRWNNDHLHQLQQVQGFNFEAVDDSVLMLSPDSGQALAVEFADVPATHPFFNSIGRLSAHGITAGCGGGNYCPDTSVTREQMAIFIERALGVNTPPAPIQQTFEDVPAAQFSYPFIEDFATRGITAGCSVTPRLYCPASPVSREQMAIFIERALGVGAPPTPTQQTFGDVLMPWFSYPFIEDFATRGITAGCSVTPKLYCPAWPVTRGQMAVFLVRAFWL
ncbi:MAG: S-layer homology domain-containing protein [Acidobacteriia bacterium]|nr:S-layer homology domain-containing protein [Terriglobia bacterium]